MDTYDDDNAIGQYIAHNFSELMTPFERRVYYLAIKREKATNGGASAALLPKWLEEETAEVVEASKAGLSAVKQQIAKQILTDYANDKLIVNRCPMCGRVVKTPLAEQCLWCGHDWHAPPGSNPG